MHSNVVCVIYTFPDWELQRQQTLSVEVYSLQQLPEASIRQIDTAAATIFVLDKVTAGLLFKRCVYVSE